jgi:histidine triad (HIT) family protein
VTDCLFCRIAGGELDAEVVAESTDIIAFRDINASAPTHVLVVPKRHVSSLSDLTRADDELLGELVEVMNDLASREGLDRGYRIVTNVGPDAGQSVQHLHFHVLGGRRMDWPPG